jgi:hypothetical protein
MGNFIDNWVRAALPGQRKKEARQLKERQARVWDCPCGEQFKPSQVKGVPQYPICPSCGRDVSEGF